MKVVKREELKSKVNEVAQKLPEDVVFIAGARQIKNGQTQIEFVQSRSLAGRKASMLALLNAGDARFNSGRTLMRVWLMVNPEGFKDVFGTDVNIDEVVALTKTADADETVGIFAQAKTINVNGVNHPVKIVCTETIDVEALPKSIREQLQDDEVSDDIKNRYILQTKDGDLIVDNHGNKIYRRYELSYGEATDVLVADKMLLSDFAKAKAGVKENTKDALDKILVG